MLVEEFKRCIHSDIKTFLGQNPLSPPICNYYKQSSQCNVRVLDFEEKESKKEGSKPTGLTSLRSKPQSCVKDQIPIQAKISETDSAMETYEPFLSDEFVSLSSDYAHSTPIKILRDTGASQSLILADTLPFSEKTSPGTIVIIQSVECGFVNVPLYNIYLSSDLVTGPVIVGIRPSLPFKGVHLLLGYDLAGDKVVVNPLLTNTSCVDQHLIQASRKFLIFNLLVPSLGQWQGKPNKKMGIRTLT